MGRMRILALVTLAIPLSCAAPTREQKDLFAWFDTLGYTKNLTLPFTRFEACPVNRPIMGSPPKMEGFIRFESPTRIEMFKPSLSTEIFYRDHGLWPGAVHELDFATYARERLKDFERDKDFVEEFDGRDGTAEFFILSRAADARGIGDLSVQLFNEAAKLYDPKKSNGKPFSQHIKDEIAFDAYNSCCDDFGNEELHRRDLLQHFQDFLNHFPDSDEVPLAKERIRVLTQMIEQDAHEPARLKNPTEKEKIAEDIAALKDYRGDTGYGPSMGVLIEENPGEPGVYDPAQDLIDKGLKAVPQLIDALDDGRYAPGCVPPEPHGRASKLASVVTVGDVAMEVLERIAKRPFLPPRSPRFPDEEEMGGVKKEIQAWWASVKSEGEKGALIEGMLKDDQDMDAQAQELARKYPSDAAEPIARVIAKEQSVFRRTKLIELLAALDTVASKKVLRDVMIHGKALDDRFAAAKGLPTTDPANPVGAMTREWNTADLGADKIEESLYSEVGVGEYLLMSHSVAAVKAVGRRMQELNVTQRAELIDGRDGFGQPFAPHSCLWQAENVIAKELTDNERVMGEAGFYGKRPFHDLRLSDHAGMRLAELWPQKGYRFECCTSAADYETQRVWNLNIFRKSRGLPPRIYRNLAPG